jgi:hypothetical protein
MGKTIRKYKGTEHREAKSRKRTPDRKFFGFTSGQHSSGVYDRVAGENVKTDRAPMKGEDFIKYGWPFDLRHKPMREYQ